MTTVPLLNVGFYNYVMTQRIIALVSSESAPMRRAIQAMRKDGNLIDATQGRRTKSIIFTDGGSIILSAISQETLAKRIASGTTFEDTSSVEEDAPLIPESEWEESHL